MLIGALNANEVGCEILVERVLKTVDDSKAGLKTGLRVLFTAKPGKREAVRQFMSVSVLWSLITPCFPSLFSICNFHVLDVNWLT